MADLRRIAFKLLKVHRPASEAEHDTPPPAALRKGPTFAEVLARRHGAVPRPAVAADVVDAAPALPQGAAADAHPDSLALELGSRIADALHAAGPLHDEPGGQAAIELDAKAAREDDDEDAEQPLAEPLPTPLAPPPATPAASPAAVAAVAEPALEHNLAVAQYLADTVARFCGDPAVARGEGWQVQLTLDAELLRDTTLHLSLSPHWLTLRFVTQDKRARALVSDHQGVLEQLLENAVVPRRDIAITVE